ncbi:MAG: sensor histidine kinase, partial [Acidimicrobiia bacterium]|nr:sensor histidine kinase [Acidimicrobiia bacterium]
EFARSVAATDDTVLDEVTRSLVEGTGAEYAALEVRVGDRDATAAAFPAERPASAVDAASFPISHEGEQLGRLTLGAARGQTLPDQDRRLAAEVAAGLGLALRNQRLTEALQRRVEELGESRRRLVEVQDDTRRTLERDLHDGAQQQLVALKVKLGLARAIAAKDGAERTVALLEGLSDEADAAVDGLRDFARGVYPPLLEAEGLGAAITAQARRAPVPVRVEADGVGRHDRQVEATVYFCVLEALQNVAKYAGASEVRVVLGRTNGEVRFTVTDDGAGFDPGDARAGSGLSNMADRLSAVSGTLRVDSAPGRGTTVSGAIPVGEGP